MQESSQAAQETVAAWPPAPVGAPTYASRSPFHNQTRLSAVIKITAAVLAVLWFLECWARLQVGVSAAAMFTAANSIAFTVTNVVLIVLYLIWTYRVEKNRYALGAPAQTYTPAWVVGYYFIPFMSLYKPYKNMVDAWQASNPFIEPGDRKVWAKANPKGIIGVWWALFIISNILSVIDSYSVQDSLRMGVTAYRATAEFGFIVSLVSAAGLFAMCRMIAAVNARQNAKMKSIQESWIAMSMPL